MENMIFQEKINTPACPAWVFRRQHPFQKSSSSPWSPPGLQLTSPKIVLHSHQLVFAGNKNLKKTNSKTIVIQGVFF